MMIDLLVSVSLMRCVSVVRWDEEVPLCSCLVELTSSSSKRAASGSTSPTYLNPT